MERYTRKKIIKNTVFGVSAVVLACSSALTVAAPPGQTMNQGPAVSGPCAALTADRATEFHGNPSRSDLNLAMAGNQWVVFNKVMSRFNERRMLNGTLDLDEGDDLNHTGNSGITQASLRADRNKYFIELIPPGKERAQILSGCMTLGNEKTTNFLPLSIQVNFDVFASTNYTEMQTLAAKGFVAEALPYTKNQLTIMVSTASGLKGTLEGMSDYDAIFNTVMFMLDPAHKVANVDHKDEGVHKGINKMYRFMDTYIRENGSPADIAALNAALEAVEFPQDGSPSKTRAEDMPGHSHDDDHVLSANSDCHYGDGTLRFCEFAVLNKSNTHETRVHHVEIPGGVLGKTGFEEIEAGPVWVSELQFAVDAGDAVQGITVPVVPIPDQGGKPAKVNGPVVYSIAFLASIDEDHQALADDFMAFIREEGNGVLGDGIGDAQDEYVAGGFNVMTTTDLAGGEIYDCDGDGVADEINTAVTPNLAVPQTCD